MEIISKSSYIKQPGTASALLLILHTRKDLKKSALGECPEIARLRLAKHSTYFMGASRAKQMLAIVHGSS